MQISTIQARDLNDCWFLLLEDVVKNGNEYTIERGSYEGHTRLELDFILAHIKFPNTRPLIPEIPPGLNIPQPTTMEYVESYMEYLIDPSCRKKNEVYTYADYVGPQFPAIVDMLKKSPKTNQACITIGDKNSIFLSDPPCLRTLDFRAKDGKLHLYVYFRSNDLWGGWPANLASIQLLKEYIAEEAGLKDGEIIYSSKGLHLYDFEVEYAKKRLGNVL